MSGIFGSRWGRGTMAWVGRFGVYPGGYSLRITFALTRSGGDPAIGGPIGPASLGFVLWHAVQLAR